MDKNLDIFVKEWEANSAENAISFKEKTNTVTVWFPELQDKEKISEQEKNLAFKKISEDIDFIKNVYSELRSGILKNKAEEWPAPEIINKNWALFRYLQFHLMSSLELFYRQTQNDKKFLNMYLDMDYCILGSLADGLASKDKIMEYFYKEACPEKVFLN